ncbi:hypothetical protein M3584_05295 [Bacillus safensis]|uniref:hypothetical protein n=1 Tax=Bacillus TaxID=1386 RepID=UPI00203C57BE|nr:hypothetical protein [Bacillus safensis]MCM3026290.1 hypothetical protein [Bacillus safensis]
MKKLMKACTVLLVALGALTFSQTEGAHATAQVKEPVIAKAPIMNKVITIDRKVKVGWSGAFSIPISKITLSGDTDAVELKQTAPNFTWIYYLKPGFVKVSYLNSDGELVINNYTITY